MGEAMDVPGEHRIRHLVARLRRSAALLLAARRRHEVVDVVGRAETDGEAAEAVSELLEIDEATAAEVVEMPVRAFTRESVQARQEETSRLEERLEMLRNDAG